MSSVSHSPPARTVWVKRAVLGWALFLGALGAVGWTRGETPAWDSAIVSLFACVMMLNASYQLRNARSGFSKCIWSVGLVLFGGWSGYSAHHAVSHSRIETMGIESFWLLAFFTCTAILDPFLGWAVADTERTPATSQPPSATPAENWPNVADTSATVVEFPTGAGRNSATPAAIVAGLAGLSASVAGGAADVQPPGIFEPPGRTPFASREDHAAQLLKARVSQRMVAERTGLTRYAVSQLSAAMKQEASA